MVLLTLWILETCILLAIAAHHLYWTWMSLPSSPGNLHLEPAQRSKCPSVWVADLQAPSGRWDCHCWYWGWQAANAVSPACGAAGSEWLHALQRMAVLGKRAGPVTAARALPCWANNANPWRFWDVVEYSWAPFSRITVRRESRPF